MYCMYFGYLRFRLNREAVLCLVILWGFVATGYLKLFSEYKLIFIEEISPFNHFILVTDNDLIVAVTYFFAKGKKIINKRQSFVRLSLCLADSIELTSDKDPPPSPILLSSLQLLHWFH